MLGQMQQGIPNSQDMMLAATIDGLLSPLGPIGAAINSLRASNAKQNNDRRLIELFRELSAQLQKLRHHPRRSVLRVRRIPDAVGTINSAAANDA